MLFYFLGVHFFWEFFIPLCVFLSYCLSFSYSVHSLGSFEFNQFHQSKLWMKTQKRCCVQGIGAHVRLDSQQFNLDRHDSAYPSGPHKFFQVVIETHSFMKSVWNNNPHLKVGCTCCIWDGTSTLSLLFNHIQIVEPCRGWTWDNRTHYRCPFLLVPIFHHSHFP